MHIASDPPGSLQIISQRRFTRRVRSVNSQRENNSTDKGAIAGQVMTVQGEPVADAAVMITDDSPSHKDISALTNEQGKYRFDDLIPGDYTIMVNAENYVAQPQHAHVEADNITSLDFSLTILTSNTT